MVAIPSSQELGAFARTVVTADPSLRAGCGVVGHGGEVIAGRVDAALPGYEYGACVRADPQRSRGIGEVGSSVVGPDPSLSARARVVRNCGVVKAGFDLDAGSGDVDSAPVRADGQGASFAALVGAPVVLPEP